MRTRVHLNLHKMLWTFLENGKQQYRSSLLLADCEFRIAEGKRLEGRSKGKRTVHAWAYGRLATQRPEGDWVRVSYNPWKAETFYIFDTMAPVYGADFLDFRADNTCWALNPKT